MCSYRIPNILHFKVPQNFEVYDFLVLILNIKRFLVVLIDEVEPLQQTEACARHCIESMFLLYVFLCHIEEFFF